MGPTDGIVVGDPNTYNNDTVIEVRPSLLLSVLSSSLLLLYCKGDCTGFVIGPISGAAVGSPIGFDVKRPHRTGQSRLRKETAVPRPRGHRRARNNENYPTVIVVQTAGIRPDTRIVRQRLGPTSPPGPGTKTVLAEHTEFTVYCGSEFFDIFFFRSPTQGHTFARHMRVLLRDVDVVVFVFCFFLI